MKIVGTTPDGKLVESIEIAGHPFFVGTQFHPEYKSRPLSPHPLFMAFVKSIHKIKFESGFARSNLSNKGGGIPRGNLGVPLEVIWIP